MRGGEHVLFKIARPSIHMMPAKIGQLIDAGAADSGEAIVLGTRHFPRLAQPSLFRAIC